VDKQNSPGLGVSIVPLAILIGLLSLNFYISTLGISAPSKTIVIFVSAVIAALVAVYGCNTPLKALENGISRSIQVAVPAIVILLVIGAVMAAWIMSGIVPTLVYYGLELMSPSIFLPVSCLICIVVSLCIGSSWSTSGTVGIALMAIGEAMNVPLEMVAGAVISGAYFGDKMSALSETTTMAPAVVGVEVFDHIRHMMFTSGPAIVLALIGFSVLNLSFGDGIPDETQIAAVQSTLDATFSINLLLLAVPVLTITLMIRGVTALAALIAGLVLAVLCIPVFQQDLLGKLTDNGGLWAGYASILSALASGFSLETGNAVADKLISRGGMSGMLSAIWLIIIAMIFGGIMEGAGMLQRIAQSIIQSVSSAAGLIGATIGSCVVICMTTASQYMAIIVPARMYRQAYLRKGIHPKNLSRAVEDCGTVVAPVVPWASDAIYHAGVLGVATTAYLPYCLFNLLSPFMSILLASMNKTITRLTADEQAAMMAQDQTDQTASQKPLVTA